MPLTSRCCGHPLQVIPLRPTPDRPAVELLRCRRCTRSAWRSGGTEISRTEALGALGPRPDLTAPPAPAPAPARSPRRTAPVAAPTRAVELRELLTGWQVLGS